VVPPPLLRRPKLKRDDQDFLSAFYACNHSRQSGGMGGHNPITISEVRNYLDVVGIDTTDERAKYLRVIQLLDSIYLTDAAEKVKAQQKNKKP